MNTQLATSPSFSEYYNLVKTDTTVYTSINCILDKIEQDNNLTILSNIFKQILEKELNYTITGKLKRTSKGKTQNANVALRKSTTQ